MDTETTTRHDMGGAMWPRAQKRVRQSQKSLSLEYVHEQERSGLELGVHLQT